MLRKILILLLFFTPAANLLGRGIVVSDDELVLDMLADSSGKKAAELAADISDRGFDEAIIHLGRSYMFRLGGVLHAELARRNFSIFQAGLKRRGITLYVWFLSSFGAKDFTRVYGEYRQVYEENMRGLKELGTDFKGLVIDVEWINHPAGNNNEKMEELLAFLQKQLKQEQKRFMAFVSLIENEEKNTERGYDTRMLRKYTDQMINMIYFQDNRFVYDLKLIRSELTDEAAERLFAYLKKQEAAKAVSVLGGFLQPLGQGDYLEFINMAIPDYQAFKKRLGKKQGVVSQSRYYQICGYKALEDGAFSYTRYNEVKKRTIYLKKGQLFFTIEMKKKLLRKSEWIFEYFYLRSHDR